jgi:hypothetical protein
MCGSEALVLRQTPDITVKVVLLKEIFNETERGNQLSLMKESISRCYGI